MKRIKLTIDHAINLGSADGSVVQVGGKAGEELDVADDLAALFVAQCAAVELKPARRAIKPRGETRTRH